MDALTNRCFRRFSFANCYYLIFLWELKNRVTQKGGHFQPPFCV